MRKKGNAQPLQALTPLEPQSRAGETPLKFQAICPHNGAAVLKGSKQADPVSYQVKPISFQGTPLL